MDQITGFIQKDIGMDISLSMFLKFFYILGVFYYLIKYNFKMAMYAYIGFCILFFSLLVVAFMDSNYIDLINNINHNVKMLFFLLIFMFVLVFLNRNHSIDQRSFTLIVKYAFYILVAAIFLSFFGFGYAMYGISESGIKIGNRGYFIAGNELTSLYVVLYTFYLSISYKRQLVSLVISIVLGLITAILIGTKGAIIGMLFSTVMVVSLQLYISRGYLALVKIISQIILVTLFVIYILKDFFYQQLEIYINRWYFFLGRSENLFSFLLSSRDLRWNDAFEFYYIKYNIFAYFFGTGSYYQYHISTTYKQLSFEIDPLDLLFSNGVIGLIYIYSFWIYIMVYTFKLMYKNNSSAMIPVFVAILLSLIMSFASGHVIDSAMSTFYLGLLSAYSIVLLKRNIREQ